jgi:CubicO group peptidase (beta-lactamase class C family)
VEKTGPTSVRLRGRARTGGASIAIGLELAPSQDTITGMRVDMELEAGDGRPAGPGAASSAPPARAATDAELAAALDGHVAGLVERDEFSGVVLVARDEDMVFEKAYGLASLAYRVPNRLDTRFDIGSLNKLFTKTAVLQLAREGRLDLDATVDRYLSDVPAAVGSRVTVRHLVNHRSGLGDIFTQEFARASKDRFRTPRDYFPLFIDQPLAFEPGSRQAYSNAGYIVLGAIIEAVTGEPYDAWVRARIYGPAGMTDTAAIDADLPAERVAEGYTRPRGERGERDATLVARRRNVFLVPFSGTPAGGGHSSARDLARFVSALRRGTLLPPALAPFVLAGDVTVPTSALAAEASPGTALVPSVALGGGAPGVNAHLGIEGAYTIVVLSNYDPPSASAVGRAATDLLPAATR